MKKQMAVERKEGRTVDRREGAERHRKTEGRRGEHREVEGTRAEDRTEGEKRTEGHRGDRAV